MSSNITEYTGYEGSSFVFEIELQHDVMYRREWMADNWHISLYLTGIYFAAIIGLKKYMKNRKQFHLRKFLFVWNAGLGLFSFCGMYRAIPELVYVLWNHGFKTSVCNNNINSIMGFWCWAFAVSKAVELYETLFIILMKREITPLQVIHHVVSLVGGWYHYRYLPSLGRYTIGINCTVHTLMYPYFAAKSANVFVPEWIPLFITRAQIIQFFIGLYASVYTLTIVLSGEKCIGSHTILTIVLYIASYIWLLSLFVSFYVKRYRQVRKDPKKIE